MRLYSWDFQSTCPADGYFRLAHAFADSAVALFVGMTAGGTPSTYHHAKVAAALLDHGLELFLKGALVLAGQRPPRTHKMSQILCLYRRLYPDEECAFTGSIDDAVRDSIMQPAGEFLRYPENRSGVPWSGNTHFDLSIWLDEATRFRDDYRRLELLLRARSSGPPVERPGE